jgi:uncharacterized membrane protein YqjE
LKCKTTPFLTSLRATDCVVVLDSVFRSTRFGLEVLVHFESLCDNGHVSPSHFSPRLSLPSIPQIVYLGMFSQSSILEAAVKFLKLDSLKENLLGYVEARVNLLKLEVREDVAKVITRALVFGVIIFLASLFILFLSLGISLFLNRYFKEDFLGFWIVSGFYFLLFIISLIFRRQLFQYLEHLLKDRLKHKE